MILGLLLLSAALILALYNVIDDNRAGRSAESAVAELETELESKAALRKDENENTPDYVLNPEMDMPVRVINGHEYIGVLKVPALSLKLPVLSEWSYDNLTVSPCRYVGSVYQNNMVIAAHNYRSHFGSLRSLKPGDRVTFTDMSANRFDYEVVETEILTPEQVEEMKTGDWDLTLFTCTVGGEYRITVRCSLVK